MGKIYFIETGVLFAAQLVCLIMLKFEMQIHFTNWLGPSEQIKIIAALFHPN